MTTGLVLLLLLLIAIVILASNRCKLFCPCLTDEKPDDKEGMKRLAAKNTLAANAYGYNTFPRYRLPNGIDYGIEPYVDGKSVEGMQKKASLRCVQRCFGYAPGSPENAACVKACVDLNIIGSVAGETDVEKYSLKDMQTDFKRAYSKVTDATKTMYSENYGHSRGQPRRARVWQTASCKAAEFWNAAAGECQPIFQGSASAQGVWSRKDVQPMPFIAIPGTTRPSYGTGTSTPFDYVLSTRRRV